jgi:hypothetical protein
MNMHNKIQDKHVFELNIIKRILACILRIYSALQYI